MKTKLFALFVSSVLLTSCSFAHEITNTIATASTYEPINSFQTIEHSERLKKFCEYAAKECYFENELFQYGNFNPYGIDYDYHKYNVYSNENEHYINIYDTRMMRGTGMRTLVKDPDDGWFYYSYANANNEISKKLANPPYEKWNLDYMENPFKVVVENNYFTEDGGIMFFNSPQIVRKAFGSFLCLEGGRINGFYIDELKVIDKSEIYMAGRISTNSFVGRDNIKFSSKIYINEKIDESVKKRTDVPVVINNETDPILNKLVKDLESRNYVFKQKRSVNGDTHQKAYEGKFNRNTFTLSTITPYGEVEITNGYKFIKDDGMFFYTYHARVDEWVPYGYIQVPFEEECPDYFFPSLRISPNAFKKVSDKRYKATFFFEPPTLLCPYFSKDYLGLYNTELEILDNGYRFISSFVDEYSSDAVIRDKIRPYNMEEIYEFTDFGTVEDFNEIFPEFEVEREEW